MFRTIIQTQIALTVLFALALVAAGQEPGTHTESSVRWGIPAKPMGPEDNAVYMEHVRAMMRQEQDTDDVLILIARLGRGETSHAWNRRRLSNVSERYKLTLGVPAEKIVVAEGASVDDYGRVEIYWRGRLIGALPAFRNKDLHVTCCGPDEMYYPYRSAAKWRRMKMRER